MLGEVINIIVRQCEPYLIACRAVRETFFSRHFFPVIYVTLGENLLVAIPNTQFNSR
jgi:hypothetical protein